MSDTPDLARMREVAEKASPGPWELLPSSFSPHIHIMRSGFASDEAAVSTSNDRRNAAFIALANPAAILSLLDRIAELTRERDVAYESQRRDARYRGEAERQAEDAEAQVSALQAQVDGLRDVGVLQEALERAWKDCGAMAPHPSPAAINIIGRHMAHHIPEVVREFSQPPADEPAKGGEG